MLFLIRVEEKTLNRRISKFDEISNVKNRQNEKKDNKIRQSIFQEITFK